MQNKANFRNDKMSANLYMTGHYGIFLLCGRQKTKPIQTQFNPIQTQLKPIQTQFQSQTNPIFPAIEVPATLLIDDYLHPAYNDNVHF